MADDSDGAGPSRTADGGRGEGMKREEEEDGQYVVAVQDGVEVASTLLDLKQLQQLAGDGAFSQELGHARSGSMSKANPLLDRMLDGTTGVEVTVSDATKDASELMDATNDAGDILDAIPGPSNGTIDAKTEKTPEELLQECLFKGEDVEEDISRSIASEEEDEGKDEDGDGSSSSDYEDAKEEAEDTDAEEEASDMQEEEEKEEDADSSSDLKKRKRTLDKGKGKKKQKTDEKENSKKKEKKKPEKGKKREKKEKGKKKESKSSLLRRNIKMVDDDDLTEEVAKKRKEEEERIKRQSQFFEELKAKMMREKEEKREEEIQSQASIWPSDSADIGFAQLSPEPSATFLDASATFLDASSSTLVMSPESSAQIGSQINAQIKSETRSQLEPVEEICLSSDEEQDMTNPDQINRMNQARKEIIELDLANDDGDANWKYGTEHQYTDDDLHREEDADEEGEDAKNVDEDGNNCGGFTDDRYNIPDADGLILINIGHSEEEKPIYLPPQITSVIKPHQIGGVRFLWSNCVESLETLKNSEGVGCILAHAMGLGKTIQVISFVDVFLTATPAKHVVIIVPVNTLQNWVNEFNQWTPKVSKISDSFNGKCKNIRYRTYTVFELSDSKKLDSRVAEITRWKSSGGVLLLGYEMYRILVETPRSKRKEKLSSNYSADSLRRMSQVIRESLVDPGPDLIVCDEGHRIKNDASSVSKALKDIKTKRRIVLTGYPLQNNLMEYWCMVDFIRPGYLGSKEEFANRFEKPIRNGQFVDSLIHDKVLMRKRAFVLADLLKGFVQRRSHEILTRTLPDKLEHVFLLRLTDIQKRLLVAFFDHLRSENLRSHGVKTIKMNPIFMFTVCNKIWNHPDILYSVVKEGLSIEDADVDDDFIDFGTSGTASRPNSRAKKTPRAGLLNGSTVRTDRAMDYSWAEAIFADGYQPHLLENSNKMVLLFELIDRTVQEGERLLVFSQSLLTLNMIEYYLQQRDVPTPGHFPVPDERPGHFSERPDVKQEADQSPGTSTSRTTRSSVKTEAASSSGQSIKTEPVSGQSIKVESIKSENIDAKSIKTENVDAKSSKASSSKATTGSKWCKHANYFRIDGSTNSQDRERYINKFNSDERFKLFLLSTRAGCLGINLVGASRIVIFDVSWNPCHDAQAACRIYRYGQARATFIYRLVADNSLEKKVYDRQISKQGMSNRVVDDENPETLLQQVQIMSLIENLDNISEPEVRSFEPEVVASYPDAIVQSVCSKFFNLLTKEPFRHESLLLHDRKTALSKIEKITAKKQYQDEKDNSKGGFGGGGRNSWIHGAPVTSLNPGAGYVNPNNLGNFNNPNNPGFSGNSANFNPNTQNSGYNPNYPGPGFNPSSRYGPNGQLNTYGGAPNGFIQNNGQIGNMNGNTPYRFPGSVGTHNPLHASADPQKSREIISRLTNRGYQWFKRIRMPTQIKLQEKGTDVVTCIRVREEVDLYINPRKEVVLLTRDCKVVEVRGALLDSLNIFQLASNSNSSTVRILPRIAHPGNVHRINPASGQQSMFQLKPNILARSHLLPSASSSSSASMSSIPSASSTSAASVAGPSSSMTITRLQPPGAEGEGGSVRPQFDPNEVVDLSGDDET